MPPFPEHLNWQQRGNITSIDENKLDFMILKSREVQRSIWKDSNGDSGGWIELQKAAKEWTKIPHSIEGNKWLYKESWFLNFIVMPFFWHFLYNIVTMLSANNLLQYGVIIFGMLHCWLNQNAAAWQQLARCIGHTGMMKLQHNVSEGSSNSTCH